MREDKVLKGDTIFNKTILLVSLVFLIMVVGIFITLTISSFPSIIEFGFHFITGKEWDPVLHEYGAMPFLIGTLVTSFIALFLSFPISLTIAIFLGEYFKTGWMHTLLKGAIELLAGIPSIVYGFWGLFVLVPLIRQLEMFLEVPPYGVGIFTAAIILAIMIIPYTVSIAREVITMTPTNLKEAAYALGASRYEVIKMIIIPFSGSGIFAGALLALGRALGETMAVTMVIGNSNIMPDGIFAPGNTMASLIANEFTEATDEVYLAALVEIGLILFVVTALINYVGKYIIKRVSKESM